MLKIFRLLDIKREFFSTKKTVADQILVNSSPLILYVAGVITAQYIHLAAPHL